MIYTISFLAALFLKDVDSLYSDDHGICMLSTTATGGIGVDMSGCPALSEVIKNSIIACHKDTDEYCPKAFVYALPELLDAIFQPRAPVDNSDVIKKAKNLLPYIKKGTKITNDDYVMMAYDFLTNYLEGNYMEAIKKRPNFEVHPKKPRFNNVINFSFLTAYAALVVDCCTNLPQ